MLVRMRIAIFLTLCVTGICLIAFGIHWCDSRLQNALARENAQFVFLFPNTFFGAFIACLLLVSVSAWLAGMKPSFGSLVVVCCVTVFGGLAANFASAWFGRGTGEYFLDGFADRVVASGISGKALAWADQVFTNQSLNPKTEDEVYLPPAQVPSFFSVVFNPEDVKEAGPPHANVYFDKSSGLANEIDVEMTYGYDSGLIILKDTNAIPDGNFQVQPRRCAERLFVYLYFYK